MSTLRPSSSRTTAAVAAPRPAAAGAGVAILLRGGNAVDAAVGAMLACCVAMPGSVGLGGYGGSMVAALAGDARVIAIDFDSRAPRAYRPEAFGGDARTYETGYLSISVPAVVAGLALALERFGALPWSTVSEPAIALAEGGVSITPEFAQELGNWAQKADPSSIRALFPGGSVPVAGTSWVQPDMARLLRRLADQGPGAFYQGDIPGMIVRQVRDHGGILAADDFERYRPEVVQPLEIDYRGYRVLMPPPPSGGLTSLQILKTLEPFELARLEPWGTEYFHLFAEAAKLAWQDRARFVGDPDVTSIPVDRLLSAETARLRAAHIRQHGVGHTGGTLPPSSPHTVNVVAADAAGNLVSLTATQGSLYGSAVAIDGLGLVMNHGMSRFTLAAGSPNAPAAGKRMGNFMAPAVVLGPDRRPFAALGLPGGRKIVTVTAQLVVNLVDFQATPAAAVHAPRVHVETDEPVGVSSAVSDAIIAALRALGHNVRRGQDTGGLPLEIGGVANALVIDPKSGERSAASQRGEEAALTVKIAPAEGETA